MEKDVQGSGRGRIYGTFPESAWRDWEKTMKNPESGSENVGLYCNEVLFACV
jgi:hypothetical protein